MAIGNGTSLIPIAVQLPSRVLLPSREEFPHPPKPLGLNRRKQRKRIKGSIAPYPQKYSNGNSPGEQMPSYSLYPAALPNPVLLNHRQNP